VIRPLPPNFFRDVVERIDAGRRFALVTVLRDSGSTPRKAGCRAMVDEAGALHGTIGGGPLEAQAVRMAVEAIASGAAAVFDFKFSGPSAADNLPICGGTMRVLVDATAADSRAAYAAAAEATRTRRRGVLVTQVGAGAAPTVAVQFRGSGDVEESMEAEGDVLVESLAPVPTLIVVGGGHVGQALAQHAALVGFEIVLVEDRPEFADAAALPAGTIVRCGDIAEILSRWPSDSDTYIALVSRGHVTDSKALAAVLHKPAAYLGMMGSRRKISLVRKHFVESGLAGEAELERLRAPIGLEIGAQTVPEIAASIVAELVAVRRGRDAGAGSGR
jgi:xanthine dehydrogenase accessory factor